MLCDVGVVVECICVDFGFGFGKVVVDDNYVLLVVLLDMVFVWFDGCVYLIFVGMLCKLMFGVVIDGKLLFECVVVSVVVVLCVVECGVVIVCVYDVVVMVDVFSVWNVVCVVVW